MQVDHVLHEFNDHWGPELNLSCSSKGFAKKVHFQVIQLRDKEEVVGVQQLFIVTEWWLLELY